MQKGISEAQLSIWTNLATVRSGPYGIVLLRKDPGYKFGNPEETISSALGKNERDQTLSKAGKVLSWILNLIDKDHCKKSIVEI